MSSAGRQTGSRGVVLAVLKLPAVFTSWPSFDNVSGSPHYEYSYFATPNYIYIARNSLYMYEAVGVRVRCVPLVSWYLVPGTRGMIHAILRVTVLSKLGRGVVSPNLGLGPQILASLSGSSPQSSEISTMPALLAMVVTATTTDRRMALDALRVTATAPAARLPSSFFS